MADISKRGKKRQSPRPINGIMPAVRQTGSQQVENPPVERDPAVERGERIATGKAIARGGKSTGHVPGATGRK